MDRVVLATMCPGKDEPLAPWAHDGDPYPCSVQGLGRALGEVWEGCSLSGAFVAAARSAGVVIVNANTELVRTTPGIADALRGSGARLALLQEGDARVWDTLDARGTAAWLAAARAADALLLYNDDRAADWTMLSGTPARRVILPAPGDAKAHRLAWNSREHAIHVGSAPGFGRGGALGAALARAASPTATVYAPRAHYRRDAEPPGADGVAAEYRATLVPWEKRSDFLARLSRCRLAVNLDPLHTYGRFAADCAALAVPCVGTRSQVAQRALWPELTVPDGESAAGMLPWLERALVDPGLARRLTDRADEIARGFAPEAVRATFKSAMAGIL